MWIGDFIKLKRYITHIPQGKLNYKHPLTSSNELHVVLWFYQQRAGYPTTLRMIRLVLRC